MKHITLKINEIADKYFGGNNSKFAEKLDTNEANIRNYRNGTAPKLDFVSKLHSKLEISYEWLLSDDNDTGKEKAIKISRENPDYLNRGIPLIPLDAMAGFGKGDISVMELNCERYVVPAFNGAEYLIQVKGSSMYPKYSSGDIVACKNVPMNDVFFQWNKVYVLDTAQGPIIKRVEKGDAENYLLLISENGKYKPFELSLKKINAVAIVIGVIRLE